MSKDVFHFRQFSVKQSHCAMKVGSDACILGAWTPVPDSATNALDIGAGTGLLSLMLAQRHACLQIHAIELDAAAAQQANENFLVSPFKDRLVLHHGDARSFAWKQSFDLIICNPPFFTNSLTNPAPNRRLARHDGQLTIQNICSIAQQILRPSGIVSVLVPYQALERTLSHAIAYEFLPAKILSVHSFAHKAPNRAVVVFQRQEQVTNTETLTVHHAGGAYTREFLLLLRDFYLFA